MNWKYLFLFILLILTACEPAIKTIPTSQYFPTEQNITQETEQITPQETIQELQDPCANILCQSGQTCKNGNCELIQQEIKSETPTLCNYGQIWEDGECTCAEGRFWCPEQNKCIQNGDCCLHSQCKRFERCVPTQYRVRLCIQDQTGKLCRLLADNNRTEIIAIGGTDVRIGAANWYSDESINFTLNNQTSLLKPKQTIELFSATIYSENFEEYGGFCKLDEED